jgi:import receptor subunit TOM20
LNTIQIIESVIEAASEETLPSTPEEKEKYFMQQVALGEGLCNQGNALFFCCKRKHKLIQFIGEAFYNDAVLPFYLALRVYPAPMELIMIYQKTVPEPVFQMIINAMALDVNLKRK